MPRKYFLILVKFNIARLLSQEYHYGSEYPLVRNRSSSGKECAEVERPLSVLIRNSKSDAKLESSSRARPKET
jgi:hypothetical protein